jgi:hypothetical protein
VLSNTVMRKGAQPVPSINVKCGSSHTRASPSCNPRTATDRQCCCVFFHVRMDPVTPTRKASHWSRRNPRAVCIFCRRHRSPMPSTTRKKEGLKKVDG